MHSFVVHSNDSACRKKVRLGLEQVISSSRYSIREFNTGADPFMVEMIIIVIIIEPEG